MHTLMLVGLIAACLGSNDMAPNEVGLRLVAQDAPADSLPFEITWQAPPREAGQTPIEGYEWQFMVGTSVLASGTTSANVLRAKITVARDCTVASTTYRARVRATGNFNAPAPWGTSQGVAYSCDSAPPGPPVVNLDTIPGDVAPEPPDSLVLLPTALNGVGWEREGQALSYQALGDTAVLCAFAYRGGEAYLSPRAQWVATMDPVFDDNPGAIGQVMVDGEVLQLSDAEPAGSACWNVVAVGAGSANVHLCTTDCPVSFAGMEVNPWLFWLGATILVGAWLFELGRWLWRRRRQGS